MTVLYTAKQGQYLAFIYYYTKIHGQPPAEADLQRYFKVSPPSIPPDGHDLGEGRLDQEGAGAGSLDPPLAGARAVAGSGVARAESLEGGEVLEKETGRGLGGDVVRQRDELLVGHGDQLGVREGAVAEAEEVRARMAAEDSSNPL